ncbi:MAG: hypothetical protein HY547_00365 [Elusimicrobia bacterium]|nr:hypothetical protein [Elusimicrobiota bacterium]
MWIIPGGFKKPRLINNVKRFRQTILRQQGPRVLVLGILLGAMNVELRAASSSLPSVPDEVPSIREYGYDPRRYEEYERRSSRSRGPQHSEWNLDEASSFGIELGFFSQPSLLGGGNPNWHSNNVVDILHTVVTTQTAGVSDTFIYSFSRTEWSPSGFLPEIVYRYYVDHGMAVGVSLGYGSLNNRIVSNDIGLDTLSIDGGGDDSMYSYARLEIDESMRQVPLIFFVQMDSKSSLALKPHWLIGLGLINTKVDRTYTFSVDTDIDYGSESPIEGSVSTSDQVLLSASRSQTVFAGRVQYGIEWAASRNHMIRLELGYQAATSVAGSVDAERQTTRVTNKDLGSWSFSGLLGFLGVDFVW